MNQSKDTEGRVEVNRELRGHRFYPTPHEAASIPGLYETENLRSGEKIVQLHYFVGGCDWWLVELDAAEMLAFGYVSLGRTEDTEWGYVSLVELEETVARPNGWPVVVERDLNWVPRPAAEWW